jgi:hypothetical protein
LREIYKWKIFKWKLIASRPVGHPKIRWMDNVMKDIQATKLLIGKGVHRIEKNRSQLLSIQKLKL